MYDLARLTALENRYDGPISGPTLLAARADPAAAVLAVYKARANAYRRLAQIALRDLRHDPDNDFLHRRLYDYRVRFRDLNRFYWRRRRALDWELFKIAYRTRQGTKRRPSSTEGDSP
jgi:hypothetical protein